jgi:radical SAM superfamily enzyme with C-terminal helix-hairpin-helix motif
MLKRQEREVGRNRHWRSNFKQLQRQLIQLEEDEVVLDSVFPQVRVMRQLFAEGDQQRHAQAAGSTWLSAAINWPQCTRPVHLL